MKRIIFFILVLFFILATLVFAGPAHMDMDMSMGRDYSGVGTNWYLLVDDSTHFLLIDNAKHRLKI